MQSWPKYLYCFWVPGLAPCPRWESGQGRAGVGLVETLFLFPCSWINMPSLWSPSSDSVSSPSQKSVGSAQKALSPCSPTSLSCDDGSSQDTVQRWAAGRERFLHFGAPSISSAAFLSLFSSLCDSMCGTVKISEMLYEGGCGETHLWSQNLGCGGRRIKRLRTAV